MVVASRRTSVVPIVVLDKTRAASLIRGSSGIFARASLLEQWREKTRT